MSQSDFARNLAIEQRKRLVGSLMDFIEKQVYPHLPSEKKKELRDKVLSSVGAYHDFVLDVFKASVNDGTMTNEVALELLRDIHSAVSR